MQRNDISLSEEELGAIWKAALKNKHDFNGFRTIFSEGLYHGIQKIQNDKEVVREALYLAAKNGDFDKFKRLFETGIVQVNEHHFGKTFLYAVIKSDTQSENDLTTIGRKKIAKYLLDNGADMDLRSSGLTDEKPSPWEMCDYHQKRSSDTWLNKLSSMLLTMPQYGLNVFPVLKEYREKRLNHIEA